MPEGVCPQCGDKMNTEIGPARFGEAVHLAMNAPDIREVPDYGDMRVERAECANCGMNGFRPGWIDRSD